MESGSKPSNTAEEHRKREAGGPGCKPPRPRVCWVRRIVLFLLLVSVGFNLVLYVAYGEYFANVQPPVERFHSGAKDSETRIAVLRLKGTIMGSVTRRMLSQIKRADEDERVKGVVLAIDSPGGLVADSHQIYHALTKLRKKKPIYVAMQRMAASGGVYVAMGAGESGKIFVEPTTWTGSIGVIIPRYNVAKLAETHGVEFEPLKTGPLKDALSPFRDMTEQDKRVWDAILKDSFDRFVGVVAENREDLDDEAVRALATGQIYTAQQALDNKLVDEEGFEEDVIAALQADLKLAEARVVTYDFPPDLLSVVTGFVKVEQPRQPWENVLDASVPRALYYFGWAPTTGSAE